MATSKQKQAAKENIKKAQDKWQSMSRRQRSASQPEGRRRKKPGTTGEGNFYRIVLRDKNQFSTFRNQDVGEAGGLQRLAGRRKSGSWDTQAWLIEKTDAHVEGSTLKGDTEDVKNLIKKLGSKPTHVKGDVFKAKPRPNVAEKDKPTKAQKQARQENIKKAQAARRDG